MCYNSHRIRTSNITYVNNDGLRFTRTDYQHSYHILEKETPEIERWMNEHPEHGKYGPWKFRSSTLTN